MYACAIFLALMSTLESDLVEGTELAQSAFGFIGYGSGSKSKVFEGTIQEGWKDVVSNFKVFEKLTQGSEINYSQYEKLHRKQIKESIRNPKNEFVLQRVESEGVKLGARYYEWIYS
jgi:hydroxymethylglutaryl-CoA synthase